MSDPKVAIIILNWNGLKDTLECLSSLKRIKYKNYLPLVVDNGSQNNELKEIKQHFPEVVAIQNEKNLGFAQGNNIGIKNALSEQAEYILLLNNDTQVSSDFLNKLVEFVESDKTIGIVGPKILYYQSNKIWFAGGKIQYWSGFGRHIAKGKQDLKFRRKDPHSVDYITGCCLLIKTKLVEKIGLLDEDFFAYTEDADWCFRARRADYKVMLIPESVIWHKKSASAGNIGSNKISPFQAYYFARNAFIFAKKNLIGLKKIIYYFGQFTFRFLYFFVFQCQDNQARINYLKGMKDGLFYKYGRN